MISRLHKVTDPASIDWYPFLGRPRLSMPETDALAALGDRSILVTGAGGSIGRALSLRLVSLGVRKIVLLDASEQAVYRLQNELTSLNPVKTPEVVLGSIADEALLDEVFAVNGIDLVFHAAAHKHVPLLETNPFAAITTNALATRLLISVGKKHGAKTILLSTDKAVAPASVLGATKQVAEQITLAASGVVVRLTNVLGTDGSVVETFLRQIEQGQPLVVRHREAARYFVTPEEAVDLLLTASYAVPPSSVILPSLEHMHTVLSLASFLLETCNAAPGTTTVDGNLHACEKLCESLCSAEEAVISLQQHGYIYVIKQPLFSSLDHLLNRLDTEVSRRNLQSTIEAMQALVPDYSPSATLLALKQTPARGVLQS